MRLGDLGGDASDERLQVRYGLERTKEGENWLSLVWYSQPRHRRLSQPLADLVEYPLADTRLGVLLTISYLESS